MVLIWMDEDGLSQEANNRANAWTVQIDGVLGLDFVWLFDTRGETRCCVWCKTPILPGDYRYRYAAFSDRHICLDCAYEKVKTSVPEPPSEIEFTVEEWLSRLEK